MKRIKIFFMFISASLIIWVILAKGQGKVEPKLIMEKTFSEDVLYSALEEENGELIPKVIVTKNGVKSLDNKGITKAEKKIKQYTPSNIRFSKNKKSLVVIELETPSKPSLENPGTCVFTIMDANGNVLRTLRIEATEETVCEFPFYISDDGKNIVYIPIPMGGFIFENDKGEKKEIYFLQNETHPAASGGDFSNDGKLFAFNTGYYVVLYDLTLGKELWRCKICDKGRPFPEDVHILPNNKYICAGNSTGMSTFDYHCISIDGQLLWSRKEKIGPIANTVTFSPDNKYIALSLPNSQIGVIEIATGKTKWIYQENDPDLTLGINLKLSNNGKYLIASAGPRRGYESNKYYKIRYVYLFDDSGNRIWTKELDGTHYTYEAMLWMFGPEIAIDKEGTKFSILNGKQYQVYSLK